MNSELLPTLYIPHGGGPCFFMDWTIGPADTWNNMRDWLVELGQRFLNPKAILIISAHWEESIVTVQSGAKPNLFFDYYGFPKHTYELEWPAPGAPELAKRIQMLLSTSGIESREDNQRGYDHGAFVPLKVAYPNAEIPTLQLSLDSSLDPKRHLEIGRALKPLREEGVLIIGAGLSFHNTKAIMTDTDSLQQSMAFDSWLVDCLTLDPDNRSSLLIDWEAAPFGRFCHPREEHLLPLMVAAGAAEGENGICIFSDQLMGVSVSGFEFGSKSNFN